MLRRVVCVVVGIVMLCNAAQSRAGYLAAGYDLQVVKSEQGLSHSALNYQTNGLWSGSGRGVDMSTSFTLPSCQDVHFARLYLDLWGGTKDYTCTVTASLNGTALATLTVGSAVDANPTFSLSQASVYGSGAGAWQIAYPAVASLIKKDGSANTLTFKVTDANNQFDGRTLATSLVAIVTDPSINQTLDYQLAEADGTLRNAPGTYGSPTQRTLTLTGINTASVTSAAYHAGYTHGSTSTGTNNLDQIFFNGTRIGPASNDATVGDTINYPPSHLDLDVASLLSSTSAVRYSVDGTELGGTGDSFLRANLGVLEVVHPVPEPGSLLAASMLLGLTLARRTRHG